MLPDVQALPDGKFWFWALLTTTLSGAALYFAFRNLARARIIEDTPTSRIRSAHQGYVELTGTAAVMQGEPIISPLTMTPCCWFRYKIERKRDKGWSTVRSGASEGLFLLRDDTGVCIIDPEGAEVTATDKTVWYGNSPNPSLPPPSEAKKSASLQGIPGITLTLQSDLGSRYRYTEETIFPGDRLYTIGLFKSFGEADHMAMREDLIKQRLSQWKADHRILLQRFDRDGDGKVDMTEWEVARRAAKREVTQQQLRDVQPQTHTLSRTQSSRHPFLISAREEFHLARRFRQFSIGAISGFFVSGAIAVWLIAARFVV
jgi:hypothetical protein